MSIEEMNYIESYIKGLGLPTDLGLITEDSIIGYCIKILSYHIACNNDYSKNRLNYISKLIQEVIDKYYFNIQVDESKIVKTTHYNKGNIETIEFFKELKIVKDFCIANSIKYLSRYKYKETPLEDLRKVKYYIDYLVNNFENID